MTKKYDILLVGAGLTSATICALLKNKYKICVVDAKQHIGGTCADYRYAKSHVPLYGPHILHTSKENVIEFLSQYSEWIPLGRYNSFSEIWWKNHSRIVPFPYSEETSAKLGERLSEEEIIDIFFRPYSEKMWGEKWENLPDEITKRVVTYSHKISNYFYGDKYVLLPKDGYTNMISRMFDGVPIVLNVNPSLWKKLARSIPIAIYCGRVDTISPIIYKERLRYRTLDFFYEPAEIGTPHHCVNVANPHNPFLRMLIYRNFFKDEDCDVVEWHKVRDARDDESCPLYPFPTPAEKAKYERIIERVKSDIPNVIFMGRLGTYRYINMDVAVEEAMRLVKEKSWDEVTH